MNADLNLAQLNRLARQRVNGYQHLAIARHEVGAPYAINVVSGILETLMREAGVTDEHVAAAARAYKERQVGYGWYRGKGTPQELAGAVEEIARGEGVDLQQASEAGIVEYMKLNGLGVDCSGFVFNVLDFAFDEMGQRDAFWNCFAWPGEEQRGVNYAGTAQFAEASVGVEPDEVRALDLILIRKNERYDHVALVVGDGSKLAVAQSTIGCVPTGVNMSGLRITDGRPEFDFRPALGKTWSELWAEGQLEFRRLKPMS